MKQFLLFLSLSLFLFQGNILSQSIDFDAVYSNNSNDYELKSLYDGEKLIGNFYTSNTWIEIFIEEYTTIDSIVLFSNEFLESFYLSLYNQPMYELDKCEILENDDIVSYKIITKKFKTTIKFNNTNHINFIKLWSDFDFTLNEIEIYGNKEDLVLRARNPYFEGDDILINGGNSCHDGIDNDGDGLTDCEDYPCSVGYMTVFYENPTCSFCNNGKICIKVINARWVSIDGGQTWEPIPPGRHEMCFDNLGEGAYNVVAKSPAACIKEWEKNPVILEAKEIVEEESCENGGVEYGTFINWSGGVGNRTMVGIAQDEFPNFDNDLIVNGQQNIIASASFHDNILNNAIVPENGNFLIKLGNDWPDGSMQRLNYSFDITDANSLFSFWFAAVLDDPDIKTHHIDELPFFAYKITINDKIEYFEKTSSNDPFLIGEGGTVRYIGWSCRKFDLSEFIGETAYIEFVTADCAKTGHYGYAYIDALCHPINSDNYITIVASDFICNDVFKVHVDGKGYNQYQYSIKVKKPEGDIIGSYVLPQEIGYNASKDDFIGYLADNEISLPCPSELEIRLELFNDCREFESLKYTSFYYCPIEQFYPCKDIWVYYPYLVQNFKIPGKYDCEGCEYNWQPASYFVDNTVPNPVFKSEYITNFAEQNLYLTITDELCPIQTEFTVQLHQQKEVSILEINPIDNCSGEAEVSLKFKLSTSNYYFDHFYDIITVELDNNFYTFEINIGRSGPDYIVYTGMLPKIPGRIEFDLKIRKDFPCDVFGSQTSRLKYDPLKAAAPVFSRIWLAQLFNGYRPSDGNYYCNLYSPEIDRCWNDEWVQHNLKSSVYKIELSIFDEWGNMAYNTIASVPFDSPYGLDGPEAFWDGTYGNGMDAPSGVYIAQFIFYSCSDNSFYQGCYEANHPLDRTSNTNVQIETVDVTLIR